MAKRVFLVVLDSFGIGEAHDANKFGDKGSNTLAAVCDSGILHIPNMNNLGLLDIDGHKDPRISSYKSGLDPITTATVPQGMYARVVELSAGKDTTIGHWEIAGLLSDKPMPTYPNGFPDDVLNKIRQVTGRDILCNKPYSGTQVIADYGEEHINTGSLIVYTSADSVLQIAAHEDVIPIPELYDICTKVRDIMVGEHAVGRVIARPFEGDKGSFTRTSRRHDFSLAPRSSTMLDILKASGKDVISVGKIVDIFAGNGITRSIRTSGNTEGIQVMNGMLDEEFEGLCFINLVDFDMLYGHRNDVTGYANALNEFDNGLGLFLSNMNADDLLIITADHGCDPSTSSTDHSRENVPLLIYGDGYSNSDILNHNLGTLYGFNNISAIVLNSIFASQQNL